MHFALDVAGGFRLAFQGVAFLGRHRSLWKWAILPAAINLVVFAAAFATFLIFYPDLYDLATRFVSLDPPQSWYAWLWVAPLRLLTWMIGLLLIVTALVVVFFAFLILGTAIAAPLLDVLSQQVEEIVTGRVSEEKTTLLGALRGIGGSIVVELRKLGFFVAVQAILFGLGLIPLLTPFTVLVASLFTMLFLPLEYAGFAMDHRQMPFAARRALIWQQRWLMLGFGAAGFLTLLIPLLNFVCLPALVVGGTLLFLHVEGSSKTEGGRQKAE
jgi:CysZ protein